MDKRGKGYYEWGIVGLLAVLGGVFMLNRLAIVYLFPFIISEFKISYAQAGALASVLAVTAALGIFVFGALSDRIGRKIIIIPATILFSLMSWASGIAQNFLQMFLARALMGIGVGAVLPTSIATIAAESTPSRRGFNFGLHTSLAPLVSVGIGAILVTQLTRIMSWRMVLFVVGVPGLLISIILYFFMREPKTSTAYDDEDGNQWRGIVPEKPGFFTPLKYRNVCISCVVNFLVMCCLVVFSTFSMVYLTEVLGFPISGAGILISLIGFAGFAGCILLPMLSDHIGRKNVLIPSLFVLGLSFIGFISSGPSFPVLAILVGIAGFATGGVAPIVISAIPTESVPPHLAATASGIPASIGEIFGAALMPFVAGWLGDLYGLKTSLFCCAIPPLIAGFISLLYVETAPAVTGKRVVMESME